MIWTMTAGAGRRVDWRAERDRVDLARVATNLLGPAPGRRGERGRKLWWRCPLGTHEDRDPSFAVETGKAWWKCWECAESGDAAALVMRVRGCTFPEALAHLTGVPMPTRPGKAPARPAAKPRPAPHRSPRGCPRRTPWPSWEQPPPGCGRPRGLRRWPT
jgi:hypothetical protein